MEWRCSFHFHDVINKIVFTSPEATVINLAPALVKNPFFTTNSSRNICKFYIRVKGQWGAAVYTHVQAR